MRRLKKDVQAVRVILSRTWTARSARPLARTLSRAFSDDSGGEVLEYVLVALVISVVAVLIIAAFGTKVLARWNSVNSSL